MSTDKDELDKQIDWIVADQQETLNKVALKKRIAALISQREQALLLKIGKGDPQNPLVYQARISQELSRLEALTPPKRKDDK